MSAVKHEPASLFHRWLTMLRRVLPLIESSSPWSVVTHNLAMFFLSIHSQNSARPSLAWINHEAKISAETCRLDIRTLLHA